MLKTPEQRNDIFETQIVSLEFQSSRIFGENQILNRDDENENEILDNL